MSSGRKITDLERLTQPGGKVLPDDETIPVLTERLALPSLELDTSLPATLTPDAIEPVPDGNVESSAETGHTADKHTAEAENTAFPDPDSSPTVDVEATLAPPAAPVTEPRPQEPAAPDVTVDWAEVEEQAREALLRELQSRLASEIDRQLRERLQPTLVRMLLATVTELRPSIEAAVRESVTRAVAAEVARQRVRE